MITKRQYILCSYFLSRVLFLGGGVSLLFSLGGNDAWFCYILGYLLGFPSLFLIYKIYNKFNRKELIDVIKNNIFIKIIFYVLVFWLSVYILTVSTVMSTSFFLFKTPALVITICFTLVVAYAVSKGNKVYVRVAEIIFPLSIVVFLIKTLGYGSIATNYLDNVLPFLANKPSNLLMCTLVSYIYSFVPNILLLTFSNNEVKYKDIVLGYSLGCVTIFTTIFITGVIFGFPLASIIRYPEYMVLKNISLFDFINNIENILTITWQFDCAISGFIILDGIKKFNDTTLPKKTKKITYLGLMTLSIFTTVNIFHKHYINTLFLYKYFYLIIGITALLLIITLLIKKKNNQ